MREIAHQHTRLRANWTQPDRHAGGSNTVVVATTVLSSASSKIDRHSHTKTSMTGARRWRHRRRRRDASWLHASCVRSYRPKLVLLPPSMTEIREVISCRSMAFPEQRKAYMLRYIMRLSWEKIAEQVVNLRGEHPSWVCVKETVQRLSVSKGCRKYKYSRCGRRPWKMRTQRHRDTEMQRHGHTHTHTGADAHTQTHRDRDAETRRRRDTETRRHRDTHTHTGARALVRAQGDRAETHRPRDTDAHTHTQDRRTETATQGNRQSHTDT